MNTLNGYIAWRMTIVAATLWLTCAVSDGSTVSPLYSRGYTVIPEPQKVTLGDRDFLFGVDWQLQLDRGVELRDVAVTSLVEDLKSRFHLSLERQPTKRQQAKLIKLSIAPGSIFVEQIGDRDREIIAQQAYRIELAADRINISANAPQGLFYGVQTLLQLIKPQRGGNLWLPEAQIVDWPDLQLREIYWDDAHHLERVDELKRAIRQASFFKINGFTIKLEGHFQYKSAPAIVEPYALSPAELQALTDYGLRYYVQLIPYLDAPAHIAFILKHPEYAHLRAFPDNNYELCTTNPDSYKLMFGMYQDLLDANKGVKYFHLATDEPYYVGLPNNSQCNEEARAKELGSVGKLLAEFVTKLANYLHERGRAPIIWGEYPLKPDDIPSLPSYIINGEVYGPGFDSVYKSHGIRQMIYTATQGEEPLFPDYYILPSSARLHPGQTGTPRVPGIFEYISYTPARKQADLMGVVVAAWADAGLHPETFWLGYATGAAAGWHPNSADPTESMNAFYPLFYGSSAQNMARVYQLMSTQAQFWDDSWEWAPSTARKRVFDILYQVYSNTYRTYLPPQPPRDQTLTLPSIPAPGYLVRDKGWRELNARRIELAGKFLVENDELRDLLRMNMMSVEFNRYNLEVFLSIANLYRQNLVMIQNLGRINTLLGKAEAAAAEFKTEAAVTALDQALGIAAQIWQQRNKALQEAEATWYKSWHPRVAEANGRRFLHELDDVKDHEPDRTIDMSYLVYRQLLLPFGEWTAKIQATRNAYAQEHKLPLSEVKFDWSDTRTLDLKAQTLEEIP